MKKSLAVFSFLILAGCADGGAPQGPYAYSAARTGDGEYRITLAGHPGVSDKELKPYFSVHGRKLCGDKVYLLRGVRDEFTSCEERHVLLGDIECVDTDYFN